MENGIFWSEIGSGFGETGGTPLLQIPRSIPLWGRHFRKKKLNIFNFFMGEVSSKFIRKPLKLLQLY